MFHNPITQRLAGTYHTPCLWKTLSLAALYGLSLSLAGVPSARAQATDTGQGDPTALKPNGPNSKGNSPAAGNSTPSVTAGPKVGKPDDKGKKNGRRERPARMGRRDMSSAMMRQTVLVFPPDTKGGLTEQLTDVILDVEKGRLIATQKYGPLPFNTTLPTVRRAVNEQSIALADVSAPYDNLSKARKISTLSGYNIVLITSIDDYSVDAEKQQASLIMSLKLVDFTRGTPRIVSAGDTITSAAGGARDANDVGPALDLARNLTERLMTQILSARPSGTPTPTPAAAEEKPAPAAKPADPTPPPQK